MSRSVPAGVDSSTRHRLGLIDHGFVPRKLTVGYVAICTGTVDIALLHTAFGLLCRKYPMLTGTIEITGDECWLRIPGDGTSAAGTETVVGPIADWLATTARSPLDPAHSLAKLTIVSDRDRTAIALQVSHAINDATLGSELLAYFWHTAAALESTAAFPGTTSVYPHSLEHAYLARGLVLPELDLPASGAVHSIPAADRGEGAGFAPAPEGRITLSRADTAALRAHARAAGVTLHALLTAAIVRAERAILTEFGDATDLPMIMFHLVDLRTHLRPVARADEVTNALGFAPTVTACGLSTDLEALAAQAKTQIVAGIRTGGALTVMRAAAGIAAHGGPRKGVGNFLTNWGVVPDLAVPAGVEIVDFHGFATSEPVSWVGYFVSTFAGRAALELAFSPRFHAPAQIAALRALICANLTELTVRARSR
ncbi:phthiocerol/phthiodiolone dimycocerosyl transferase family protein [Nocardia brasiliensis]|uniref:phthiocerol/phthiodiolone dimycocerosyl transferase family protein n=1 Tax=Nocardia brasiliensis TaxID=37326 RepID=UPI001893AA7D|nr:hypothetical protein [Nocardia brasiliensis]MBF6125607.1 hypothetical protein [Nocardia brasiliensis]